MLTELSSEALSDLQRLSVVLADEHPFFDWVGHRAIDEDVRRQKLAVGRPAPLPMLALPELDAFELRVVKVGLSHLGVELVHLAETLPDKAEVLHELSEFAADLYVAIDLSILDTPTEN